MGSSQIPADLLVFDQGALEGLMEYQIEGNPDIISEFAQLFLAHAPARLGEVQYALKNKSSNLPKLQVTAHSLKSVSQSLGLQRLHFLCATIEASALAGNAEKAFDLAQDFEAELNASCEAMSHLLKRAA
jgi:HPt (histidine-containing phosphotransfer) domain-containing protein